MKRLIVLVLCLIGSTMTYGQLEYGVKAGLNFNTNGELTQIGNDISNIDPDSKTGFHVGIYAKSSGESSLYIRPELIFTKTKSDYDGTDFDMSKLDLPILVGFEIFKPLSIFAGPSLQYILETDLKDVQLDDVENDFSVGINIGAALDFDGFGVDVRYEKGLSENLANFAGISTSRLDTRPEQFIVSLSLKF
jgi:hypothetical protein